MSTKKNPIQHRSTNPPQANPDKLTGNKKPIGLGMLTFVIFAGLFATLAYQRFYIKKVAIQKETTDMLATVKERLQETLGLGISAAKTLSFFIQKDGSVKNFDSIAAQILATNPGVDALELVPGGVITQIYPPTTGRSIIGYNILKDANINKEAFKAIKKKELFYAGPFPLKQGGMGIVGRYPVFKGGSFWGFSAVVIKLETLWKAAGIDTTGKRGYYFQVAKFNPATQQNEFFVSNPTKEMINYPEALKIASEEWTISAHRVQSAKRYPDILMFLIVGCMFSVLGGFFVYHVARKPQLLDQLVKIRTAALQKSEEKYRFLIEQASDGIIVYSLDGTIHQYNKMAYLAMGYNQDEFSRLHLKDLLGQKEAMVEQVAMDALHAGRSVTLPKKLYKKDGSIMHVEINMSMLPDKTVLAFVRDSTKRIAAENALKESEQKFSRVFQTDLVSLAIFDADENLVDANDTYVALLEADKKEIVGTNTFETKLLSKVSTEMRVAVKESIGELLRVDGRVKNYELQIETSNKKIKYLLFSIEPLDVGGLQHWLNSAFDITEKKNANILLAYKENKYRSLIEQASDGIIITDFSGIIVEVNNSICTMLGYAAAEMMGRHLEIFMSEEDLKRQPLRIEVLLQGKGLLYERTIHTKDGTSFDVEINAKMAAGNTLIGYIRDITERKKAGNALRKSNETYELVAKATTDAIWDHNFSTKETTGNQNFYNLYGLIEGIDTVNSDDFETRVHPEDKRRIAANLKRAIAGKASSTADEYRFKTVNGNYKHIYDRAYIVYHDNGAPSRMLGVMQDITGSIMDQQQLLKEKNLSDSIINSLPAIFYLYNSKQKFLRWNKNFETVTGYTAEEIATLPVLDLFDESEKPLLNDKIKSVFVNGHDAVEADFITKDKRKIPYYFSAIRIEYEGEVCLMGFGLDFSDKALSDKRLKESEQKFRSLVEQATDGVAIRSLQGVTQYASPSLERMLGYTEAELLKLNVWDIAHPGEIKMIKRVWDKAINSPGVPIKGLISRALHKDGSWLWFEDTVTNMLHIPSINGIVENLRDVTEKLQIEKKIITEKELSDSIINSLPGIFYLYDKYGNFIRWNKNLEEITGYSGEEIKEMHPIDFYDDDEKEQVRKRIESNFQRKSSGVALHLLTKEKQKIPFYINSMALNYEGRPCIVGVGMDVTERKKIEQELVVSNQQLERKASELKASYSELERFAYIVSHDLQEPLRMVSSFLKLLEQKYEGKLDDTGLKYIHFAVDGADRMKQLIMDLLEYSRTGTNREIAADTNMNEVVAEVLNVLESATSEQAAVIETGNLPILANTSKIQMFQLIQNLLSNAIKYRSELPLKIKIDALEESSRWVFSISDNGIGIDARFSDKIFVIFQRLHNKNEYSGTGIGLSICKKIVEKHGGEIWVESAVGVGSTFFFSIPK